MSRRNSTKVFGSVRAEGSQSHLAGAMFMRYGRQRAAASAEATTASASSTESTRSAAAAVPAGDGSAACPPPARCKLLTLSTTANRSGHRSI